MKKLLTLVLFAFAGLVLPLTAADPAAFVPDKTPLLCFMDGARLNSLPWVKEALLKDADLAAKNKKSEALFARFQLTDNDLCSGAFYIALTQDEDLFGYFKTNVPEAKLMPLAKAVSDELMDKDQKFTLSEKVVNGKKFYIFSQSGDKGDKLFALTYLAPDVAMVLDADEIEKPAVGSGKNPLLAKLDRTQLAALVYDSAAAGEKEENPEILGGDLALNLTGKAQKDLVIASNLIFPDEQKATEAAQQVQMSLPMLAGMIFGKDPDLAGDVMKGLKVTTPTKTKLNVRFALSEKTINGIVKYFETPENLPDFGQKNVGGAEQGAGQGAKKSAKPGAAK